MERRTRTRREQTAARWTDTRSARLARTLDPAVAEDDYFRFANRGR